MANNTKWNPWDELPIPPVMLYILVALFGRDLHGYGIMKQIEEDTGTRVRTGTLHKNLVKMVEKGWLENCPPPKTADSDDQRRKYYRVTGKGSKVRNAALSQMNKLVGIAHRPGLSKLILKLQGVI